MHRRLVKRLLRTTRTSPRGKSARSTSSCIQRCHRSRRLVIRHCVRQCAGNGVEAWRRLDRRWDPYTAGRARGLLNDILYPGRVKVTDLTCATEKLEVLARKCTSSKEAVGRTQADSRYWRTTSAWLFWSLCCHKTWRNTCK